MNAASTLACQHFLFGFCKFDETGNSTSAKPVKKRHVKIKLVLKDTPGIASFTTCATDVNLAIIAFMLTEKVSK